MRKILLLAGCLFGVLPFTSTYAQFNLDGQLVQRTELRNGYGRLIRENADPAAFVAHRARLQASYVKESFTFLASVQDVRTWGNTPQTKLTDDYLSLHEAWLEMALSENWKLKLGRQELNYDNARFLGNLDWALQGRAHDFGLVKFEKAAAKLHFGGGYNQNAQQLSGNVFTIPNQYKTAQMARYENTWGKLQLSLLFWNDGRQFTQTDSTGAIANKGVRYRQTIALPTLKFQLENTIVSGFYYHQLGKDVAGRTINGFDASAQILHQINFDTAASRKLRMVVGAEIVSGTPTNLATRNRSFSPLYGTNHLHNGYMDLFFVGGAHENSVGLQDFFLRTRLDFSPKFFTQIDGHYFTSHAAVYRSSGEKRNKYLGTELDLSLGYLINSAISLQGGYSQFFFSDTFEQVQNNGVLKNVQNWAYLMLIFRPTMRNKFIGILL
ncbi:MAG TPA: alginate export family protein [Flavisolibacter sp.]|jgi:hypothetical protein|nr:alginate export family protein [Flavisolibacter sp.]